MYVGAYHICSPYPLHAGALRSWDTLNYLIQEGLDRGEPVPNSVVTRAFKEADAAPAQ
jgi:hypothetical protein